MLRGKSARIVSFIGIPVFCFVLVCGAAYSPLFAAGTPLADKHKSAGIDCAGCHKENPPKEAVPTAVCLPCHGGAYGKLAAKTEKLSPNPHDSHLGDLDCDKCHHAHKPAADYCSKCHSFGFKVP